VACACNKPTCFERFDLNNDTCITQDECDLQWFLLGNCTTSPAAYADGSAYGPTVWDLDGDACINYTEWEIIYDVSQEQNRSVCPQDAPEVCDECPPGTYLVPNPCECIICQGEIRRRRALECTPCPPPLVKRDTCLPDECCSGPQPCTGTLDGEDGAACGNNSNEIPCTDCDLSSCDPYTIGQMITLTGTVPGDPSTLISYTGEVVGITEVIGGAIFQVDPPLAQDFSPIGGGLGQACSSTDGTEVSASFSGSAGECCCVCGTDPDNSDCCESHEVCEVFTNGTGICSTASVEFPTPAPTVGAKGDPHLVNLQGEHFDINHGGEFTLLRFPQASEKPAEFSLQAAIQPDVGKPCTTYITQVELSGAWLGGKSVQIRCYRKSHSNDTDAFLGARLLEGKSDSPWQTIEEFEAHDLLLSDSESDIQVSLDKATWFPKKSSKTGPTAAGMFTLALRNIRSPNGAKITIRQDLPGQEHLNVAVRQLSQLGRVDVGGLLGFDAHPESLERPSAACVHHRATARYRIESQDDADHGYYFKPSWKDRWDKARTGGRSRDNEAAASLMGRFDDNDVLGGQMCKCPSEPLEGSTGALIEGVLVDEASFVFAEATWE